MANEKFRVKYGLAVGDNTTETAMSVDGTTGDIVTLGDITVGGNDIKSNGGTTAIALNGADITTGDITLNGGDIRSSGGTVAISVSGQDATIANDLTTVGDVYVNGGELRTTATSASVFPTIATTVSLGGVATTVSIGANTGTTTVNNALAADSITVSGDAAINGGDITTTATDVTVFNATATTVNAFNAGTIVNIGNASASQTVNIGNASTANSGYNLGTGVTANGSTKTVNLGTGGASGSITNVNIGSSTSGALGTTTINNDLVANNVSITTLDTTNLEVTNIKAKDGTAAMTIADTTGIVTVSTQLTVDNININGNTISSTNTNGDILITPNGTGDVDLVTDTVQVGDANATATITTNGTGDLVLNTNSGTNAGNITLTQGTNGNITLTPNGTGRVVVADNTTGLGSFLSTTNLNYSFPLSPLTSISGNNGLDAASSMPASSLGYGAQQQFTHYFGDTFAGPLTTAVLSLKSAFGNSVTGGTVPFTGAAQVAPSALVTNSALGTINYNGYATTNFTDFIGTRNQGGGYNGLHATQIQSFALENFADGTLTLSGATITNVVRFQTTLSSVSITGTRGQISFTGTTPTVGTAINVSGTNSGTGTGITAGTYYVVAVTSATNVTLSATVGGVPLTTTAGTTTGLTFLRRGVTFTYTAQANIPFGTNALVTVANVTGVTNGTYMTLGTSTTTSLVLGIDTTAVSLPGTQSLSVATVTNAGTGFRVRAFPVATTMNAGNRLELIDHRASAATYRADSFVIAGGTYGNTGATYATFNATNTTLTRPLVLSGSTSGTVQISAPAVAGTQTYTLPTAQPTANNQVLVSTTGGVMSWAAPTYLDAEWVTAIGTLTANTIYGLPLASVSANNVTIATGAIAIDNATATGPTRITFPQTGRYNLQFSIQLANTDSAEQDFDLWLRKNTVDVADSNTQITVIKQQGGVPGKNIMSLNLLLNVTTAGDYYELVYAVTNANLKPETIAAITTPYVRPRTPAVLLTVVPVVGA